MCFLCLHCLGSRLLCRELSEAGPGLYALPRSKPLRFRYSGAPERCRLVLACVLCLPRSKQLRYQVLGKQGCCNLSPLLPLPLGFLDVQPAYLLRRMLTIQNPKKSWLAKKPACSLVDNVSLGPRVPPSHSGCPCLPVTRGGWAGLHPASSAQSFVL